MSICYDIYHEDGVLYVKASGKDSGLEEVVNYQKAIHRAALDHKVNKVFCDERELRYNLGLKDTYKLASLLSQADTGQLFVAIVTTELNYVEATFFAQLIKSKDLRIKFFQTKESGKKWLQAIE